MDVFAVFIDCDSNPGFAAADIRCRWIDSQWALQATANERACELDRIFNAFHVAKHKTRVVKLSVADMAIKEEAA